MKYILASASLRRQELLKRLVNDFYVVISDFDEESVIFNGNVENYVQKIAKGKALAIESNVDDDAIIIAADTIVALENEILKKPTNENDAFNILKKLSGKVHKVYTAVVVINKNNSKILEKTLFTEVTFSDLSDEDIINYINTGEPMDKAGAYGIQGKGGVFVEKINGCYYNVVGFPLNLVKKMLDEIT